MRIANPCILLLLVSLHANYVLAAPPQSITTLNQQMEIWWADLEKADPDASRALLNFSSHPDEAVAFLKHKLRPLIVDPDIVDALLTQLDSTKESEWKQAFEDLEYFDPRLAIDLPTLMDQVKESPARQRLVEILGGMAPGSMAGKTIQLNKVGSGNWYNFYVPGKNGRGGVSYGAQGDVSQLWNKSKWDRAVRAEVLLEHIHTSEALTILKDMASGHPDIAPTKVAQAVLARWDQKQ